MRGAVWQYDKISGEEKFNQIKKNYLYHGFKILEEKVNSLCAYIVFDNGDIWRLIPAHDNSRGYKLNISYIDHRIDSERINCIIKPATIAMPYQAFHYF